MGHGYFITGTDTGVGKTYVTCALLQAFAEKGIIHVIPTSDNSVIYALCRNECVQGHHHDNHVHFICDQCAKTICLEDVTVPEVRLPKGFKPSHAQMIVSGICGECK